MRFELFKRTFEQCIQDGQDHGTRLAGAEIGHVQAKKVKTSCRMLRSFQIFAWICLPSRKRACSAS